MPQNLRRLFLRLQTLWELPGHLHSMLPGNLRAVSAEQRVRGTCHGHTDIGGDKIFKPRWPSCRANTDALNVIVDLKNQTTPLQSPLIHSCFQES